MPIRDYLERSCTTSLENGPSGSGIVMNVSVTPHKCMEAFVEFLLEKIIDNADIDMSKDINIFITASTPVDVPLEAIERLRSLITSIWTRGKSQVAKVTVLMTREPFSGALFGQDWVFSGRSIRLEYRTIQRILKKDSSVLFQIIDIGHITGQWCILEIYWEQTLVSSIREGGSSSRVVTEETSVSVSTLSPVPMMNITCVCIMI